MLFSCAVGYTGWNVMLTVICEYVLQEARGSRTGAEYYVSNILEELDDGLEFFVDLTNQLLYFQQNNTGRSFITITSEIDISNNTH